MKSILGISAFYHDSAASIIINGKIIAAAQEERFTRIKHDLSYPFNAIQFVLKHANLKLSEVDHIVFFEKPFLKFERLLETYVAFAPKGFKSFCKAMPIWLSEKLFQKTLLFNKLKEHDENFNDRKKIMFSDHHLSHAASAYYPSPFNEAIVLTADGVGEWATTTLAIARENKVDIKKEIHFPHSLGLLYSAFTYYTGFKVNSGEYKLMGLAPYGKPIFKNLILDNLLDLKEDGSFKLNMKYFNYTTGLTMTNSNFSRLFGHAVRDPNKDLLSQFHMDIASSIQAVTEEIVIKMTKDISTRYKIKNLCLAGGVALNCVANGILSRENIFDNIWVQPAAGDAGGALGAALAAWHISLNKDRFHSDQQDEMSGSYLGPSFSNSDIEDFLNDCGAIFHKLDEQQLIEKVSSSLVEEKAIGWFQGRMEFGPRALGNRSIIADPRSKFMQKQLNLKVKYRESFRPFAPSVLLEDLNDWFDINSESPYMLMVGKVKKEKLIEGADNSKSLKGLEKLHLVRSKIPAVTHVDNSARIQTVTNKNGIYYDLIKKFKDKTGCPIIVNTSFNVRGEPPVNTPIDAFKCFMSTDLDLLIIGNCVLEKGKQIKFDL